jgi:capsular polysaccharide biosynthesis protein/Mrp family chromosome partitioning ATPase
VLVVSLLAGAVSFLIASATSGSYAATATLLISVDSSSPLDDVAAGERLAKTYTELIKTSPVMEESAARLGGPETADDLETAVSAQPLAQTQLMEITASSDSPERAAEIANTVAQVFVEQVAAAEAIPPTPAPADGESGQQEQPMVVLTIVEPAETPTAKAGPSIPVQTFAGIIAGASLVLIVLAGRAYFDSSVWNPDDLRAAGLKLPCLGVLPDGEMGGASLLTSGRALPALTEASRTVATTALSRLKHLSEGSHAVGVVSAVHGEGRTSIAARLGVAAALEGLGVTIVDFDLRHPTLHEEFRIPISPGITEAMWSAGERVPALAEIATSVLDDLKVVPAGQDPSLPARRLSTSEVSLAVDQLKSNGTQVMFFDTPPLSDGTEAVVLGQVLDSAIVVVEARKTTVEEVIAVAEQMEALGLDVLGYVLNKR